MQLIKLKKNRNIISTTLKILREEGPTAFFQGHVLGQVFNLLGTHSDGQPMGPFVTFLLSFATVLCTHDSVKFFC